MGKKSATTLKDMHLRLQEDSFRLMLDAMAIARWVVCAGQDQDDQANMYRERMDHLEQLILRQGMASGYSDTITCGEMDGRLCHYDFERGSCEAWEAVEHHDKEIFWEELIWRMATSMASREHDCEDWAAMSESMRDEAISTHEVRVRAVLDRHGMAGFMMTTVDPAG